MVLKHPTETVSLPGKPTKAAPGSEVFFWSAEGEAVIDRIRGIELAWAHIEEGPLVDEVVFNVTAGRLRQPGFPGQAWVTGTHKGRDWVYQLFETDEDSEGRPRDKVGPIVHAKIEDNTFLPAEYVESLRRLYRGAWAIQELEGGHAKFEGLIYPSFDRATHVIKGTLPKFKRVVYGVDWGFLYAPVIVIGETFDDQLVVAAEWYERDVTPDEQVAAAKALRDRYGKGAFYCDHSRPENIIGFNRAGLYAPDFEQGKVDEGVREVTHRLSPLKDGRPGMVVHESCRNVINEHESYVWAKRPKAMSPGEEWKPRPADGQKDHGMDAERYAVMGLRIPPASAEGVDPDPFYDPRGETRRRLWGGSQ
jgi:phage terminase large subunit